MALVAMAAVPFLLQPAEAQAVENLNIRIAVQNFTAGIPSTGPMTNPNVMIIESGVRNHGYCLSEQETGPSQFRMSYMVGNSVHDNAGYPVGAVTGVPLTLTANPACRIAHVLYAGDHSALPEDAEIISASVDVRVTGVTDPKTCQVAVTNFPYRPTGEGDSLGASNANSRPSAWGFSGFGVFDELRSIFIFMRNSDAPSATRHVAFDDNFCLSNGDKTITFPASTFPTIFDALTGEGSPSQHGLDLNHVRGYEIGRSLMLSFTQDGDHLRNGTQISHSTIQVKHIDLIISAETVTDTQPSTEHYSMVSNIDDAPWTDAGHCADSNHDYARTAGTPSAAVNWNAGNPSYSICSMAVYEYDNEFAPGVDFASAGIFYNRIFESTNPVDCDVLITPIPNNFNEAASAWYDSVMEPAAGNAHVGLLINNTASCHTQSQIDTFDNTAINRFRAFVNDWDQGRFGSGFYDPGDGGFSTDKFAIVIRPTIREWPANSGITSEVQIIDPLLITRSDSVLPFPITTFSAESISPTAVTLSWQPPRSAILPYTGYQINWFQDGREVPLATLPVDARAYTVEGLTGGVLYTFKISAVTSIGSTQYGSLAIVSIRTASATTPGSLIDPDTLAPDPATILWPILVSDVREADRTLVTLDWDDQYDLSCTYTMDLERRSGSITLSPTPSGGRMQDTITFEGTSNDSVILHCTDPTGTINLRHQVTQQDFELLRQIDAFRDGTYGTVGAIGTLDLISVSAILLSFMAFSRSSPAIGIIVSVAILSMLAYMGVMEWQTSLVTLITLVVFLAILLSRRSR